MKKIIFSIILLTVAALAFAAAPVVSSVVASPLIGHVKISYNLAADTDYCDVQLMISDDRGASYTYTPTAVSGDIGSEVSPGDGKEIIWQPARDGMAIGEDYRAKVIADDRQLPRHRQTLSWFPLAPSPWEIPEVEELQMHPLRTA